MPTASMAVRQRLGTRRPGFQLLTGVIVRLSFFQPNLTRVVVRIKGKGKPL